MPKIVNLLAVTLTLVVGSVGAQAQTAIPPSPPDFLLAATQSDQYEILAAHLAEVQGQDQRVRDFAQKMVEDHTKLGADLKKAADASKLVPPPPAMSSDQAMLLSGLQGLRGAEFDKAYARQQEFAHVQAFAVEDSFAMAGADENLRGAAKTFLPTIKDHLQMASALRTALGGN